MEIDIKIIETDNEFQSCLAIRKQVFIIGQNISEEIELDDNKIEATYVLATISKKPVGTARWRSTDDGSGRLSKLWCGQIIGLFHFESFET